MGGNIREEWTVTGVASPHTFTPPPTEGESTTTSYWHKIGILEIGILFVATIDNINFFSSDIVPVVSVSTSTDFTSGNSVTLNNIFTDPLFLAVHPDYPIPEISSFTRYSPWRQYLFNSISSDGSSISVSLTDPSIWTNGGTNVLNGFNYFQDPEYIVTIPGNPTLSAFLSWTYLPSQDYTHIGMVIQDEDRTIFAGTPEGQAILNGPAPIAGQSNVIEKYITLQPSGTVQVKRFGW